MSEATATQNPPVDQVETPVDSHNAEVASKPVDLESTAHTSEEKVDATTPEIMASATGTKEAPASVAEKVAIAGAAAPAEAPAVEESKKEAEADEEPQNTLTSLFSQAEWKALKEFRSQLPEIFAEAFPDKADAKSTPIKIWGVSIDPMQPKDARVSVVLMKFLRARHINPSAARDMLITTLRWRESFDIEAALKEEFPPNLFENLGHISGRDKEHRPVVYNIYGGNPDIKSVFLDVQRFLRWRVALQERTVALLDFNEVDQMIQIHDYNGVSLSSRDANSKAAAAEATNVFASHYPEMLYKKFFVNVPTLLNWIFWAFKSIIPSATFAKMSVVGHSESSIRRALLPYIDDKQLPKRYGGEGDAF